MSGASSSSAAGGSASRAGSSSAAASASRASSAASAAAAAIKIDRETMMQLNPMEQMWVHIKHVCHDRSMPQPHQREVILARLFAEGTSLAERFRINDSPKGEEAKRDRGFILADDMGLGKTLTLLCLLFLTAKLDLSMVMKLPGIKELLQHIVDAFARLDRYANAKNAARSTNGSAAFTLTPNNLEKAYQIQKACANPPAGVTQHQALTIKHHACEWIKNDALESIANNDKPTGNKYECDLPLALLTPVGNMATLIVVPAAVLGVWQEQIAEHIKPSAINPATQVWLYHGPNRQNLAKQWRESLVTRNRIRVVLTTAQILANEYKAQLNGGPPSFLHQVTWGGGLIVDEGHLYRSGKGIQFNAIMAVKAPVCRHRIATGTPLNNHESDVMHIAAMARIHPLNDPAWWTDPARTMADWREQRDSGALVRRTNRILMLPKAQHEIIRFDLSDEQREVYDKLVIDAIKVFDEFDAAKGEKAGAARIAAALALMRLLQCAVSIGLVIQGLQFRCNAGCSGNNKLLAKGKTRATTKTTLKKCCDASNPDLNNHCDRHVYCQNCAPKLLKAWEQKKQTGQTATGESACIVCNKLKKLQLIANAPLANAPTPTDEASAAFAASAASAASAERKNGNHKSVKSHTELAAAATAAAARLHEVPWFMRTDLELKLEHFMERSSRWKALEDFLIRRLEHNPAHAWIPTTELASASSSASPSAVAASASAAAAAASAAAGSLTADAQAAAQAAHDAEWRRIAQHNKMTDQELEDLKRIPHKAMVFCGQCAPLIAMQALFPIAFKPAQGVNYDQVVRKRHAEGKSAAGGSPAAAATNHLIEPPPGKRWATCALLVGGMTLPQRQEEIDKFKNDPQCMVMFVSTLAGGLGLTFTNADTTVTFTPHHNPVPDDQAAKRIDRLGQHRPIVKARMIGNNGNEHALEDLVQDKRRLAKAFLEDDQGAAADKGAEANGQDAAADAEADADAHLQETTKRAKANDKLPQREELRQMWTKVKNEWASRNPQLARSLGITPPQDKTDADNTAKAAKAPKAGAARRGRKPKQQATAGTYGTDDIKDSSGPKPAAAAAKRGRKRKAAAAADNNNVTQEQLQHAVNNAVQAALANVAAAGAQQPAAAAPQPTFVRGLGIVDPAAVKAAFQHAQDNKPKTRRIQSNIINHLVDFNDVQELPQKRQKLERI